MAMTCVGRFRAQRPGKNNRFSAMAFWIQLSLQMSSWSGKSLTKDVVEFQVEKEHECTLRSYIINREDKHSSDV